MFKVNDYVVNKRDVCKVIDIKEKYFNNKDYYVLISIADDSLEICVPVDSDSIRGLISKKELEDIIERIPEIPVIEVDNRAIETEYKSLMKSSKHEDLIRIIKTTYLRNKERLDNNKKIGDKDDAYYKMAEQYLYNEFAIVLNLSFEDTKKYVEEKVDKLV